MSDPGLLEAGAKLALSMLRFAANVGVMIGTIAMSYLCLTAAPDGDAGVPPIKLRATLRFAMVACAAVILQVAWSVMRRG